MERWKIRLVIFFLLLLSLHGSTQEYVITPKAGDEFSKAITTILNDVPSEFSSITGDSIRYTWLGTDFRLKVNIPGAAMAITRNRFNDKYVYIEFRGFSSGADRDNGIRRFIEQLKVALGDQMYIPFPPDSSGISHSLSVRTPRGYFSPNLEILPGSTDDSICLLAPEPAAGGGGKDHFFLFKIYGRTPAFYYFQEEVASVDTQLQGILKIVLKEAAGDFYKWSNPKKKRGFKVDKLYVNETPVELYFGRSNYEAVLKFDHFDSSSAWIITHNTIVSATGKNYVHFFSDNHPDSRTVYYISPGKNLPRVRLTINYRNAGNPFIIISIESAEVHELPRYRHAGE